MATANDGISRFSNSTVIGVPTFTNGIGLGTSAPTLGELGFLYSPALVGTGNFTSSVPITYGSQVVPVGTYIITATGLAGGAGAVITAVSSQLLATPASGGTSVIAFSQTGESGNLVTDSFTNAINISSIYRATEQTTITFQLTLIFTGGPCITNGADYSFKLVRIA